MADTESSFRAAPNAIHKLQKILQMIAENDGNMVAKEIWREEDVESNLVLEQANKDGNISTSIFIGNARLGQLEDLLGAIDFLKSSLESRISDFRLRKPSRTITNLPDELIAYIFDISCPDLFDLSQLSLVCRTFRRIAISEPSLWARQHIRPPTPQHIVDMIVRRSGARTLRIEIISPFEPSNIIPKHCERWSDITLHLLTTSECYLFQRLTPSSKLTSLRRLSLNSLRYSPDDIYNFKSDWLPASLESLHCGSTIPKGLFLSSLTTCSFELTYNIVNFRGVAAMLSSTPLLETLTISIINLLDIELDEGTLIDLPSLKEFSFHSYDSDHEVVQKLLQATRFPTVTTLCIDTYTAKYADFTDINSCFWREVKGLRENYMHLKNLDLKIAAEPGVGGGCISYLMDEFLTNLPRSVESFSLTARDVELRVHDNISFSNLGQLRSVMLKDCNRLDTNFFRDLATRFKEENIRLNSLDIRLCRESKSKWYARRETVMKLFRDAGVLVDIHRAETPLH